METYGDPSEDSPMLSSRTDQPTPRLLNHTCGAAGDELK